VSPPTLAPRGGARDGRCARRLGRHGDDRLRSCALGREVMLLADSASVDPRSPPSTPTRRPRPRVFAPCPPSFRACREISLRQGPLFSSGNRPFTLDLVVDDHGRVLEVVREESERDSSRRLGMTGVGSLSGGPRNDLLDMAWNGTELAARCGNASPTSARDGPRMFARCPSHRSGRGCGRSPQTPGRTAMSIAGARLSAAGYVPAEGSPFCYASDPDLE